MIGPGTGVRVYLAARQCRSDHWRELARRHRHAKGIGGLAVLVQDVLRQNPAGGAVFAFRGRRGD